MPSSSFSCPFHHTPDELDEFAVVVGAEPFAQAYRQRESIRISFSAESFVSLGDPSNAVLLGHFLTELAVIVAAWRNPTAWPRTRPGPSKANGVVSLPH